ncbi:Amino Acid-Polyamine-Organocation (APC) Family [Achlya hypogyna]|uniref:Amino Acid-Polyamine-Organocation (APC) Family n=1 Tax=Achlya hypogyna TaxID=1202772 RepID=A0A1V9ZT25_ACHHY|nr:Amino Acid-Polyamine-Organocation (APC) Family [Achlya hypogyna]
MTSPPHLQRRKVRADAAKPAPRPMPPPDNSISSFWSRMSWRKPLALTHADEASSGEHAHMERTLGCFDLLMIGIGGTVGSGVFATAGLIARAYAGPGAVLSWVFAGLGCILSGASFMELSCMIPSAGSTYAYAYHSLGELPAMIAGMLLTLEYGVSSAGGARSWSDKLVAWLTHLGIPGPAWMKPKDSSIDLYAGLLMVEPFFPPLAMLCTVIVLCGMSAGKRLINTITITKISVVLFIIVVGLSQFRTTNFLDPFLPPTSRNEHDQTVFGWPGVMLGASASFYGYIGYDEVCCLAAEAKNPKRDIPRAVFGTVIGAAFLSTMATLSLVGMQKYSAIDIGESYGTAFHELGMSWAASVVETGEVVTMPVGILIGFLAQPRVQFAMARDGLLPGVFGVLDKHGNPFYGTLICGSVLTLVAVCIPFKYLWDFISLGILVAFNVTNTCLLAVRYRHSAVGRPVASVVAEPYRVFALISAFLVASYLSAYHVQESILAPRVADGSWRARYMQHFGLHGAGVFTSLTVVTVGLLALTTPQPADLLPKESPEAVNAVMPDTPSTTASTDNESSVVTQPDDGEDDDAHVPQLNNPKEHTDVAAFQAPCVPVFPCLAIWFNWFLAIQIPSLIVVLMGVYFAGACGLYTIYGLRGQHSLASRHTQPYAAVPEA